MRSWVGRGHEDISGKPFGWAHHQERDEIRAHLRAKHGYPPRGYDPALEHHVTKIQMRLRKYRPVLRERQAAARAAAHHLAGNTGGDGWLSWEAWERIAEHFAGSNDEVGQELATKAAELLARRAP